jgi:eukaryotic-like serine/threonine-protein kinase
MTDRVGQQLGHYRLVRLLGHGGFASVYLGEHIHLGTSDAIKVLDTRLTSDELEQFSNEARMIARLEHPHIVRVLDFGVEEAVPFLVLSYAPNGTLRQRHPRGTRLPPSTTLLYVKQVASALDYAHEAKLIHRDVKPQNMLLGRNNEVLLSDFGLAVVAYSSSHEGPRDVSGTIAYMAPEQARGKPRPASDQYSLGVVVYEWLCGKQPFEGSYEEVAIQHVLSSPPYLHEIDSNIPPALEEVVMKALAKDPHQRYEHVQDFADALEEACQLENLTSSATSVSPLIPKPVVDAFSQESTYSTDRMPTGMTYAVAWSPDRRRIASGGLDRTVQVWDATAGITIFIYRGHTGGVTAIAWSPDGKHIASAGLDKTVQVWETTTGHKIAAYEGHSGMVYAVAWSPDGKYIASTSGGDNNVHIWDAATGHNVFSYSGHAYWARTVAWSPDGRYLASGSWREVEVWDIGKQRKVTTYRGHDGWVRMVAWSPDGKRMASAGEDKTVQVWDAARARSIATHRGHSEWVGIVTWSPDGKRIASASKDNVIHIWDASTGSTILTYRSHSASVHAIMWLPDGKHIASASGDGAVQVWQAM